MCGIAGIFALRDSAAPPTRDELVRMLGAIPYRGPDEQGIYRCGPAGLAHARLSIIDLSGGAQPMANADETKWIVFNGEVFDHVERRAELEARGHVFRTRSDTEVLLHAYEEWGLDAFARLNGQWAAAIYDETKNELLLVRDRVGVRPLHVAEHEGRVYFGSEAKAIYAAAPTLSRRIDPFGLAEIFTCWAPVAPRTAFAGIEEIPPGVARLYRRDGSVVDHRYDPMRFPKRGTKTARSPEEAAHQVLEALREATRLRMVRSDVTVGCYLSGGIDSAIIAALARDFAGEKLQTFSIGFEDPELDERPAQATMVEHLGCDHHSLVVSHADVARIFPDVVVHAEKPLLRTGPAPMALLASLVRSNGIKVVLTGEGSDEVFAGYDLFREGKVRRFWARHPDSKIRPMLLDRLYPYLARSPVGQRAIAMQFFGRDLDRANEPGFAHGPRFSSAQALMRLFSAEVRDAVAGVDPTSLVLAGLPDELREWTPLSQDLAIERHTLLAGYLMSSQGDRAAMGSSIEGRFPFLDRDVVRLADSLPDSIKLRVLEDKAVLRDAARGLVPESITSRPKRPYRSPDVRSFIRGKRLDYVDDAFSEATTKRHGIFDPTPVARLAKKCFESKADTQLSNADNMAFVGVLSTHILADRLLSSGPTIANVVPRTVIERTPGEAR